MIASLVLLIAAIANSAEVLDNAAVIRMVQSGLGSDVITLKIEQSAGRFDVSTEGLIALKNAGVSDAVIKAILLKGDTPLPPAPVAPPQPASDVPPCIKVSYYTLGSNGWDWVPAGLCVTATVLSLDEQDVSFEQVVAQCMAKTTALTFGGSTYRDAAQEWWFTDGKDTYKLRGKEAEIKAISDFLVRKHPGSKHGSCSERSIHSLFAR
jgi:hypothetical protein